MEKARFHLPGLRYNYPLNMFWISLFEQYPQRFRDNMEIGSFFGCFPFSLWNGGRLIQHDQCDSKFVESVIKNINSKGIPIRYTFTNPVLTEEDLNDPFCNYCMDAANNGMNEVLVVSPILEQYLREKYPNFEYNSSTCKEIKDVDELNKEIDRDYKYVVLDYNLNNNWEFIDKIEHPEKLEVLVNAVCKPGCKKRGEHYTQIGKDQKTYQMNQKLPKDKQIPIKPWFCKYGEEGCIHTIKDYPTVISPDDIWDKYIPAGINNFKIEGRTAYLFSLIDTYCHYMIKPEYQGETRLLMIKNLNKAGIFNINGPRAAKWP